MSTEVPPAQEVPSVQHGPIASYMGIIKSAPFAAQYEEIQVRRSAQGASSEERVTGAIHRDSAGRVRREYHMRGSGGEALELVVISDPAARTATALDMAAKQATRFMEMGPPADETPQEGWAFSGPWRLEAGAKERMIEGVTCREAKRVVLTAAGSVVESTAAAEIWVSDEIKFAVLEHVSDLQREYTWRLLNIRRVEPASSLFVLPAGFTEVVRSKYSAVPPER